MKISDLCPLLLLLSSATLFAQEGLQLCTQIQNNSARLDCFDRLMSVSNEVEIEATVQEISAGGAIELRDFEDNQAVEILDDRVAEVEIEITQDSFGQESIERESISLESRTFVVASARFSQFSGWLIEFENGQQWRQIGTEDYSIKVGESYTITNASFRSFLLGSPGRNRTIRVSRIR